MEKPDRCELCGISGKLTKHHLIPQRVSRTTRHPKDLRTDEGNFMWICEECHSQVHAMYTEQELRDLYFTKDRLKCAEKLGKFVEWRRRHPEFRGSSKMSNRKRF